MRLSNDISHHRKHQFVAGELKVLCVEFIQLHDESDKRHYGLLMAIGDEQFAIPVESHKILEVESLRRTLASCGYLTLPISNDEWTSKLVVAANNDNTSEAGDVAE